ncbi:MAG: hypothetical protein EP332_11035 [Bacteroidetes bacterium]|nr:MAG: hypothetical protein EP332_11035 [Bacteroidota bacterium]
MQRISSSFTRIGLLGMLLSFTQLASAQAVFDQKATNIGNIGFAVSNVGTLGRPQVISNNAGIPSMEYPIGSGINHLFEAGIWIGARVNGQTRVSTSASDASTGYRAGLSGFEFTPNGMITESSSLTSSPLFSNSAVSHQDFRVSFTDKNTIIPGTSTPITGHQFPLYADITMQTYAWNFSFADYFVIVDYTITNNSTDRWDSVWVGNWNDLVVRNLNITQDGGSAFYNKGAGFYLDSLQSLVVYQKYGDDIDYTGNYAALRVLGAEWRGQFFHPGNAKPFADSALPIPKVNGNFWLFGSSSSNDFVPPFDDASRYDRLRNGMNFGSSAVQTQLSIGSNLIQLASTGPFISIEPGESIHYTVAYVAAKQMSTPVGGQAQDNTAAREELYRNLGWAYRTYLGEDLNANGILDAEEDLNGNGKLDRFVLPEPPATPKVKMIAESNKVTLYWDEAALHSIDPISKKQDFEGFRLYRSNAGDDLDLNLSGDAKLIAQWDSTGNAIGFNNGFESIRLQTPMYFDGDTTAYWYKWEVNGLLNGWQYLFILTSFDEGDDELDLPPLESSFTENSYRVFAGTTPQEISGKNSPIGVYPNPYKTGAAWDGSTSRTKKIYFYNLPKLCTIQIFTISGDLVTTIEHDASTYVGDDIRWFENLSDSEKAVFSGGEHAWDLLSTTKSTVAQGTYLFTVKDKNTGRSHTGTFVIIQ